MRHRLPTLICPDCGDELLASNEAEVLTAIDYRTCVRKCTRCDFAFSNRRTADVQMVTQIWMQPLGGLNPELHEYCLDVLENSLNVENRSDKLRKFHFGTSEDRLTWAFFRSLQIRNELLRVLNRLELTSPTTEFEEPLLLLWGVPCPPSPQGEALRLSMCKALRGFGEDWEYFTEPDVILDLGKAGMIIIEVKFRAENEVKPEDYKGWRRYIYSDAAFRDPDSIKKSQLYELARNWRLGCELSKDRPFTLVNLGRPELFQDEREHSLASFASGLELGENRAFRTITWPKLVAFSPNLPQNLVSSIQEGRWIAPPTIGGDR